MLYIMKTYIRFDSVGGASGDMILSALAALGADVDAIEKTINAFFPEHLHFHSEPASGSGLNGLRVTVHAEHHHHHHHHREWPDAHGHRMERMDTNDLSSNNANETNKNDSHQFAPFDDKTIRENSHHSMTHSHHSMTHSHEHRGLKEIAALVGASPLSEVTRGRALAVFTALAEAEAKIHGKTPDTVHFHEVGAWDSVADIVGACLALEQLGVSGVSCGPLPAGVGTIRCAHGEMPNPAPATQELLADMRIVQTDEPFELVTPTGAALLRTWSHTLEKVPQTATVVKNAFGFGSRTLKGRPNVLRATLLEEADSCAKETDDSFSTQTTRLTQINTDYLLPSYPTAKGNISENPVTSVSSVCRTKTDGLLVMETNIDDCNPEWIAALTDELLKRGALDVWQTPVTMKKGRSGIVLSVLAPEEDAPALRERIFRSTTTFGIRFYPVQRETLERQMQTVQTPYGEVPVKLGFYNGERITVAPEHDVCVAQAHAHGVSVRQVSDAARGAGQLRP